MNQYEIIDAHPKQRARQLRRDGIDGRKVGATQILKELHKIFGEDHPDVPTTHRQVHNWIRDVEWLGEDKPCDFKDVLPELRSYAGRLNLVKSAFLGGVALTSREARHAKRTLGEFEDPFGDVVDLLAQYAVVWELANREAMGDENADIESMFVFAPWRGIENSDLYLLSFQKGFIRNPPVLRLISPVVRLGESPPPFELGFGAYAQLGLPWFFGWIQDHPDGRKFMFKNRDDDSDVLLTIDHWKPACNWRKIIEAKLAGNTAENVTVQFEKEDSNVQR